MFLRVAAVVTAAIFVASIFSHVPVAKADGVTVISSSGMLGSDGYRIAGELRNDVSATIGNVVVTASLLDSYGNLMSSISGGPFIKTLKSGEKSAFVLSLADAKVGSRGASYKIDTAWNSGVDKPSTLKVSAGNGYYDGAGAYHLDGQVSNVGLITAKAVVVSAALYDNEGKAAGAGYAFTVPAQLAAGSTAPFHIVYDQTAGSPVTFSINVQSNEFSSVMDLQQSTQESSPAQQATVIAVGLDMPSYHYADTVRVTGNVSSLVAGESLVTIELLYPDGSALNSFQVPLIKNSYFASFDIVASSEFDGKTFTVRATYAASSTAASLKYLGSETPQPVKQDVKQNSARLSMSASLNDQKVMILTIKNPNGSGATVYGMNVKVDKGSIKSATGTAGWKAKVDGSLAKFTTVKPVMAGKIANSKLKVSDTVHAISWSVVDKDGHVIDSNTAIVKARK